MTLNQKVVKYFAMSFASLLTIGIVATILNVSISIFGGLVPESDKYYGIESEESGETISEEIYQKVKNIEMDSSIYKVYLMKESGIKDVKVELENIPTTYKVTYKENTHTLKLEDDNWVTGFFSKKNVSSSGRINIYVPSDLELSKVDIEMGVGAVSIAGLSLDILEVECGIGKFVCEDVEAESVDIEGGIGDTDLKNIDFKTMNFEGSIGNTSIEGKLKGKIKLSGGMGNVNVMVNGDKNDYTYKVENGLGTVYIDGEKYQDSNNYNNSQPNLMDIKGGVGDIYIDFK